MSTDEYVPSDEEMLSAHVTGRMMRDGLMRTEAEQEFRRGLARVRRDAAREALGALAEHSDSRDGDGVKGRLGGIIRTWRDAHYPEEAP